MIVGITIEKTKDGFSVFTNDHPFSGMGNTQRAAIKDMRRQMKFFKETAEEEGFEYPDILDKKITFKIKKTWN
jgi:hypothetical protein